MKAQPHKHGVAIGPPAVPKRSGFTLVELLLVVSILAMLMCSVGAALYASMQSYQANNESTAASQMVRSVMTRISSDVRMATDVDSTSTQLTITPPANDTGLTRIVYEMVGTTLVRHWTINGEVTTYVLIGPDSDATVDTFYVLREDDLEGNPLSVTVRLALSVDDQSFAATSSACLRKYQLY